MAAARKGRAVLVLALVALVFIGAAGALVWALRHQARLWLSGEKCTVRGAAGATYELSPEQAGNAGIIAAVATRVGVGQQGATIAIATSLQESKLRNLAHGDRDSLGLFQQRPSQGWGTITQVRDPVHASESFYTALKKVVGWEDLPLTEAAQEVQRSGFPDAYAAHEDEAGALATALTGRRPEGLSCAIRVDKLAAERITASGLTPRTGVVRTEVERAFGKQSLGGFAPGGVSTGHIAGSAHYEGRAIDILYRPVTATSRRRGWATATYLVASAERLHIATVIYDDRIWTARRASEGWRHYTPSEGDKNDPTNRHLDHVHVDVLRGG